MADLTFDNQAEFVRQLSRHSSKIYGFILMLSVSRNDADDVFQDTSVVLWKKYETYEEGTSFRAWACKIAYFEVLKLRRSQQRVTYLSDNAISALANDALTLLQDEDDNREVLAACLQKLVAGDRQLIEQKYFVNLSTEEIALRTSRSVYSIYRALSRVHGLLLRCMRRDEAQQGSRSSAT